jgi:hypothetical protein
MKKAKNPLGLLFLIFLLLYAQNIFAWWNFDVVETKLNGLRGQRFIVIGNDGIIHIVYEDLDADYSQRITKHAYKDGLFWQTEMIPDTQNLFPNGDIFIDSNNKLHMIFLGSSSTEYIIYYGTNCSGSWIIERVASYSMGGNYSVSKLVLDSNNKPHLSYIPSPPDVRYAYKDSTGWHIQVVNEEEGAYFSYLALDSFDNPHIVYEGWVGEETWGGGRFEHTYKDNTGWHTEVINEDNVDPIFEVLFSNDTLHILYEDYPTGNLKYVFKDSTGWHKEIINEERISGDASMILDSRGNPFISYRLQLPDYHYVFYFVQKDETGWQTQEFDDLGYCGLHSMAVDSDNNLHINYRCLKRNYLNTFEFHREYILKYAKRIETGWQKEVVDRAHSFAVWWPPFSVNVFGNNISAGGEFSIAIDSDGNPHITYVKNCFNHFDSIFWWGGPCSSRGINRLKHATRFDFVD